MRSKITSSTDAHTRDDGETDSSGAREVELCPVVESLEQLGSRWRLAVLYELQQGELRFNELKRRTDANARTLSRVLDDLQKFGFVNRRLEEGAPVATYYALTDKGKSLCPVFDEVEKWGQEWIADCSTSTQ